MVRFLVIALIICSALLPASRLADKERELQRIQDELNRQQTLLKSTKQKEKATLRDLYLINTRLNTVKGNLTQNEQRLQQQQQDLVRQQSELESTSQQYAKVQTMLVGRVRDIYKSQEIDLFSLLFSGDNFSDMINNSHYYSKLMEQDVQSVARLTNLKEQLEEKVKALEYQKRIVENTKRSIENQKRIYESQASQKRTAHSSLKTQRIEYENRVNQLLENSKEIEKMLKELMIAGSREALGTGKYIWPTRGIITSPYGMRRHPIFKTTRMHTGLDIGAPQGRNIVAADGGRVVFAGWWGGYGNAVILDHGRGFTTVYAHMHRINVKKDQMLKQGQVVGLVGSTGNSTGPHLHFEVRQNGETRDPMAYLPKR